MAAAVGEWGDVELVEGLGWLVECVAGDAVIWMLDDCDDINAEVAMMNASGLLIVGAVVVATVELVEYVNVWEFVVVAGIRVVVADYKHDPLSWTLSLPLSLSLSLSRVEWW